jgi:3-(3-hydroxy-phenyl)propionate hydroxylase
VSTGGAAKSEHAVLVAGAGPVGLTAALAVRARGLPVTVLEAEPEGRMRPGSRAIYYHGETLRFWNSLRDGLGWDIAAHGITWSTKRTFWGADLVYEKTYPPGDPARLPPFTSLAQVDTERLLFEACKAAGVEFAWSRAVAEVEPTPDAVTVRTQVGDAFTTQYLIAADGARSSVRQALGIAMSGSRSENHFVIVDINEDAEQPLVPARVFHYDHPAVGRRNVLLVPFAGGWRADLQCRQSDDPEEFNDEQGVRRWVGQVMPDRYAERVTWISTYQFLQVVADTFVDPNRRVLLVGEAAHLFAPFGARGLNSGVPDAIAAADAVSSAVAADTSATALAAVDDFAEKRRTAARYNRDAAATALHHMQARGPGIRLKRFVAARLVTRARRAGAWLDAAPYGPRARDRKSDTVY